MKFSSSLTLGLVLAASSAQAQSLDCYTNPGNVLCRQIQAISSSFNFTCTGDACYRVRQGQLDAMYGFTRSYQSTIPFGTPAAQDIASLASNAAWYICSATSTGDCSWMEAMFHAKYDALTYLAEIQQNAGYAPTICSLQYTCN